ncbi:SPOCS domain-containing protein [uncultured Clostridium sp.]|jgi:hypothetical protein|uniref:SPOCS domain-containing protein n=1 Tax=uncultured Clostridium sp. TaxID=59620 RepID=UPI00261875C5|nr:SPOCS domain-containing protein [uncultured Clostridium sp.]
MSISSFKQISIEKNIVLPLESFDIEDINRVTITTTPKGCHMIKTTKETSSEGQILTGTKIIVQFNANILINYTALNTEQSIHTYNITVPFSHFVVIDHNIGEYANIEPVIEIEDIKYSLIDKKTAYVNAMGLLKIKGLN